MFVILKLTANHAVGSVVNFNESEQKWGLASSVTTPLGIVESVEHDEETDIFWGRVAFCGVTYAIADRAIPDQGGELAVLNGKVYVGTEATQACGIIAPLPRNQESRIADELVMVHIR